MTGGHDEPLPLDLGKSFDSSHQSRFGTLTCQNLPRGPVSRSRDGVLTFENGAAYDATPKRSRGDGGLECVVIYNSDTNSWVLEVLDEQLQLSTRTVESNVVSFPPTSLKGDLPEASRPVTSSDREKQPESPKIASTRSDPDLSRHSNTVESLRKASSYNSMAATREPHQGKRSPELKRDKARKPAPSPDDRPLSRSGPRPHTETESSSTPLTADLSLKPDQGDPVLQDTLGDMLDLELRKEYAESPSPKLGEAIKKEILREFFSPSSPTSENMETAAIGKPEMAPEAKKEPKNSCSSASTSSASSSSSDSSSESESSESSSSSSSSSSKDGGQGMSKHPKKHVDESPQLHARNKRNRGSPFLNQSHQDGGCHASRRGEHKSDREKTESAGGDGSRNVQETKVAKPISLTALSGGDDEDVSSSD